MSNNKENDIVNATPELNGEGSQPQKNATMKSGEKGFTCLLFLMGVAASAESYKMFAKNPVASSYGALPLFLSVMIAVLSLYILFEDRKKATESEGLSMGQKFARGLGYIFTKDTLIVFGMMIAYCYALYAKVGFIVATPIFLFAAMTYLMGNFSKILVIKNLIYTGVGMAFIMLVFKVLFKVVLP